LNKQKIVKICEEIRHGAVYPANIAMEIYSEFNKKEVMARTKYKGTLEMGSEINLNV
jgi:hypothetical protein